MKYREYKKQAMKDPKVKEAYEDLENDLREIREVRKMEDMFAHGYSFVNFAAKTFTKTVKL
jgi:hypothetical protein